MALRLIEMVLPEAESRAIYELLKESDMLEYRQIPLTDGQILVRILLDADRSEATLDLLEQRGIAAEGNRIVIVPVQATLPRVAEKSAVVVPKEQVTQRINREELYEDIKKGARCSRVYVAMALLATIVAAIGLYHNSVTLIIGAMVMAPLLGPNMALALGTTLGDLPLLRRALLTNLAGIVMTFGLAVLIGIVVHVNPEASEIVSRTRAGVGDFAVALASGCAGALAFTTGVSATLIGVMVAVAVLPPLVTSGVLLGGGYLSLALGALGLFAMNIVCVNLAGVATFFLQGIHPAVWWEKDRAVKATRIAIGLWSFLLLLLIVLLALVPKRGSGL